MILRTLWFMIKLAVIVGATVWLASQPGRVAIDWGNYRLETSVGILVLAVVVMMGIAAFGYRVYKTAIDAPGGFMRWRRKKTVAKGYEALRQSLISLGKGDGQLALAQAERASDKLQDPSLALLIKAQAASLAGDSEKERQNYAALTANDSTAMVGWRGLIAQSIRDGELREARKMATRARDLAPKDGWILATLFDLQARSGLYNEAAFTLDALEKHGDLSSADIARRRACLHMALSRKALSEGRKDEALNGAQSAHSAAPSLAPATVLTATLMAQSGQAKGAAKVLESSWKRHPHPDIALAWEELAKGARDTKSSESPELIPVRAMQKLVELNPSAADGRKRLAELALDAGLWGEARSALAPLMTVSADRTTMKLMARLERQGNDDAEAATHYLEQAADAPADPQWICHNCHTAHDHWTTNCEGCGAFASLEWQREETVQQVAKPMLERINT